MVIFFACGVLHGSNNSHSHLENQISQQNFRNIIRLVAEERPASMFPVCELLQIYVIAFPLL
jgi:hypothetical protein